MYNLRTYRFLPALLALSFVLMAALPLAQHACAMTGAMTSPEVTVEHESQGAESKPAMPPCHSDGDETPASSPVVVLPCCVLVAVGTPTPTAPTLEAAVVLRLPSLDVAVQPPSPVLALDASPPDRRVPLHIALGRFLT